MNETTLESSPNYTRNLIISVLISLLITPIVKLILINAVPSLKLRTLESITLYIAITAIILIVLSLRKGKKYKLTQTSIIDSKTTVTYKEISSIKLKKSKISIPQDIGTISIYKKNGNPIKPTIILKNIENAEKIYNKLIQEIVDTKESNEIIYKTKPIPRYWQANGETILQIIRITVIAILISLPSVYLPQILNWTLNLNMTTLNIKRIMDSPTKNTLPPMVYFELLLILSVILIILYIKERKLKKTEYILRKGYIEIIQKSISITRKIWPYQNFIETEIKNKRLKQKQIGTIHILIPNKYRRGNTQQPLESLNTRKNQTNYYNIDEYQISKNDIILKNCEKPIIVYNKIQDILKSKKENKEENQKETTNTIHKKEEQESIPLITLKPKYKRKTFIRTAVSTTIMTYIILVTMIQTVIEKSHEAPKDLKASLIFYLIIFVITVITIPIVIFYIQKRIKVTIYKEKIEIKTGRTTEIIPRENISELEIKQTEAQKEYNLCSLIIKKDEKKYSSIEASPTPSPNLPYSDKLKTIIETINHQQNTN